jgi:uncharacterized protein YkwD
MSRFMSLALLIAVGAALMVPGAASAMSPQQHMLKRVNTIRAHHGLARLHFSKSLQHSATHYSRHMVHSGYFGHSSRIHASSKFHTLGEILEAHFIRKPMVGLAARNWMHSSSHRSIILSSAFRYAGAGYAMGTYQGRPVTMWTMHFGRR